MASSAARPSGAKVTCPLGSSEGKMPGSILPAYRAAVAHRSGSPSSAANSSHSSRVTATPVGCMSRSFSARNRGNSIRCHCT